MGLVSGSAYHVAPDSSPVNPEGVTAHLLIRRDLSENFSIDLSGSGQATTVTVDEKTSSFDLIPVLVGARYEFSSLLENSNIRPHLGLAMGPYFTSYAGPTKLVSEVASVGTKFGIKPRAGIDFLLSDNFYATLNTAYHLVALFSGFEATAGVGLRFN